MSAVLRATLQASSSQTANNSSAQLLVSQYREAIVFLNVTAVSGTTPTLTVQVQTSDDGGTTWYNLPGGAFAQQTAIGTSAIQVNTFGDTIRVTSTIGGTSPNFTYAVKAIVKP